MSATKKLLDKYRETCLPKNDNGMAKRLRVSRAAVSRWTTGQGHPGPELIEQMAKELGETTGPWLAEIEAERARTPADKKVWLRLAATLGTTMALAVIALPSHTNSRPDVQTSGSMPIVSNIRRGKRRLADAVNRWLSDTWSRLHRVRALPERLQVGSALPA